LGGYEVIFHRGMGNALVFPRRLRCILSPDLISSG
jgi:hypothetical protein